MIENFLSFLENNKDRRLVINSVISKLRKISEFPVDKNLLKNLINLLKRIDIKPIDIIAAYKTDDPKLQKQYLIEGPSAKGGGGNGALKDLIRLNNG